MPIWGLFVAFAMGVGITLLYSFNQFSVRDNHSLLWKTYNIELKDGSERCITGIMSETKNCYIFYSETISLVFNKEDVYQIETLEYHKGNVTSYNMITPPKFEEATKPHIVRRIRT